MTEEKIKADKKDDETGEPQATSKEGEDDNDEKDEVQEEECAGDAEVRDDESAGDVNEDREKLKAAESLMEKGNHAQAGRILKELLQKQRLSNNVRDEAEFLMERLKPDPVAIWIGVACLVLIAILALTTLGS